MRCAGVIPAAGSGLRLGLGPPKAFRPVGAGSLLALAVDALAPVVAEIVVAVPAGLEVAAEGLLRHTACPVRVVTGGASRQDSVRAALGAVGVGTEAVLVHDAARAFVPRHVLDAVCGALAAGAAAVIPVIAVPDSLRVRRPDGSAGDVVDRSGLLAVQTPQGFDLAVLRRAHDAALRTGYGAHTDDAGLVEALGVPISTVAGDPAGFKVTTAFDLRIAVLLATEQPPAEHP